jgi:peptide/nickel transport system substrate-binding protein
VSRRKFLGGAGALATTVVLYGCGGSSSSSGSGSKTTAINSKLSGPAAQGILVWDTSSNPTNINPIGPTNPPPVRRTTIWISNALLRYTNKAGVYEADLAAEMPTYGMEYEFKLRKDVLWSDGTKFTADDVVATFAAVVNPNYSSVWASHLVNVKSVTKVDDYTVKVTQKTADRFWQSPFASIAIVKADEAHNQALIGNKPTGTGPFMVSSKTSNGITFVPNPHYFKKGLPKVKGLQYPVVPVPATIEVNLVNGQTALSSDFPYSAVKSLQSKGVQISVVKDAPARQICYINTGGRPDTLGDVNFRQALAYAIDRQQIIDVGWSGYATPGQSEYTPGTEFFDASVKKYGASADVATAKAMLAKATKKPTKPLQLIVQNTPDYTNAATVLQANWEAIGVKTDIIQKDIAGWGAAFGEKDSWDLILINDFLATGPGTTPQYIYGVYQSGSSLNYINGVKDPQVDAWIKTGTESTDDTKAQAAWTSIQKWLVDFSPTLCMCYPAYVEAQGVPLSGYTASQLGNGVPLNVEDASIKTA